MLEYERRFMIPALGSRPASSLSLDNSAYCWATIEREVVVIDRYIKSVDGSVPLRCRSILAEDGWQHELTVKLGKSPTREEYAWLLPEAPVLSKPLGGLSKTRFEWHEGSLKFHVECVKPRRGQIGWAAEVEGPKDEVDVFVPPATWHEVTGDPRYSNLALATEGWPQE